MKRKEKIIGSLIISVIAILFLFIGYSKTNDKKISDSDMEKLFIDKDESEDTNELEDFNEKESSSKKEESNNIKEEKDSDIESEKEGKKTCISGKQSKDCHLRFEYEKKKKEFGGKKKKRCCQSGKGKQEAEHIKWLLLAGGGGEILSI